MEHAPKLIKIDGEWTYVPLTDEEIAEREAAYAEAKKEADRIAKEAAEKEAARAAVLKKLGLSAEEAAALLA